MARVVDVGYFCGQWRSRMNPGCDADESVIRHFQDVVRGSTGRNSRLCPEVKRQRPQVTNDELRAFLRARFVDGEDPLARLAATCYGSMWFASLASSNRNFATSFFSSAGVSRGIACCGIFAAIFVPTALPNKQGAAQQSGIITRNKACNPPHPPLKVWTHR